MTRIKNTLLLLLACLGVNAHADTINKYANIANSIPKMELKADEKSQAWARSARSILAITDETIAETILSMNSLAIENGEALVCLPSNLSLNGETIHALLQEAIKDPLVLNQNKSISFVVINRLKEKYPCRHRAKVNLPFGNQQVQIKHVSR